MSIADHFFFGVLVVAMPIYSGLRVFPRLQRVMAAGQAGIRLRIYQAVILQGWLASGLLLFSWFWLGRSSQDLGLVGSVGWHFWTGLGVALAGALALDAIHRRLRSTEKGRDWLRSQIKPFSAILPHTREERNCFFLLAVTAGVWEEILYRGFLTWYLSGLFGLWLTVLLSSALFGLAHLYQGWKGVLRTGAAGVVLSGLYLLTGSLWAPMLLHALVNIIGGLVAFDLLHRSGAEVAAPPAAGRR